MKIDKLIPFCINVLSNIDGNSKNLKIESALIESKIMNAFNNKIEFQKEKVIIDSFTSCSKCKKGFFDCAQIVYLYPHNVYHSECYDNIIL